MMLNETSFSKKKKNRIDISSIKDFRDVALKEGYEIKEFHEEAFSTTISKIFDVDINVTKKLYNLIENEEITLRADDINGIFDYMEKIILFEENHHNLCNIIKNIENLHINRVEYEREISIQDDISHIEKIAEEVREKICKKMNEVEQNIINSMEIEIDRGYVYSKDIELLKKMLCNKNEVINEIYDSTTNIKTLIIQIPKVIDSDYIKPLKGSVEYYQHLTKNIERIDRLIRNLNKYIKAHEKEKKSFIINHSETIQDTINIAMATFDNKEFKAISGKNNIDGYCRAPELGDEAFESFRVNKLDKLGIGYKRVNDSEKKILEEINKQIEAGLLKNNGELVLYSKWEPCPSCCYVINQFCEKYPNIEVNVKYNKKKK